MRVLSRPSTLCIYRYVPEIGLDNSSSSPAGKTVVDVLKSGPLLDKVENEKHCENMFQTGVLRRARAAMNKLWKGRTQHSDKVLQCTQDSDKSFQCTQNSVKSFQRQCRCIMCNELFPENNGVSCPKDHFVCWNECFEPYVHSAGQPGAIGRSVDKHGHLKCPNVKCDEEYDLMKVASLVENGGGSRRIFDALSGLREAAKISHAIKTQLADQERRLQEEFLRIQTIQDANLRRAETIRMIIVEEVNVRCPRCSGVFYDFDGCFAITCSRNDCRTGICAWCLKDCGTDAHAHVTNCPHGTGIYGTLEAFNEHRRRRKEKKIRELYAMETPEVQNHLRQLVEKYIRGVGITLIPA